MFTYHISPLYAPRIRRVRALRCVPSRNARHAGRSRDPPFRSVLTTAKEDWVIVAGHHPIYAETPKEESERNDMQSRLDPILRRHRVDIYINGHIHNFQHIRVPGCNTDYITNSAAALSRKVKPVEGTVFCSPETGFSIISADKKTLRLYMINKNGDIIHTVTRSK